MKRTFFVFLVDRKSGLFSAAFSLVNRKTGLFFAAFSPRRPQDGAFILHNRNRFGIKSY